MSKWWIGGLLLGAALFLLGLAVALDHARSGVRVTAGGEAFEARAGPGEEGALTAPAEADEAWRGRTPARPRGSAPPPKLAVHVRRADGRPLADVEVLATRDGAVLRAGKTDLEGSASLLPFAGSASLRARWFEDELARVEIRAGQGRHELVVPEGAAVAGVVRLQDAPRAEVCLELESGEEGWTARLVRETLEEWGVRERTRPRRVLSAQDGSFRFAWLPADWSGSLCLLEDSSFRFAGGSRRLALARPAEGLVLELVRRGPQADLRGRAVQAGEPVPGARWRARIEAEGWESFPEGECDARGRFLLPLQFAGERVARLELFHPRIGHRCLRAPEDPLAGELGDVELVPTRALPFVVTSDAGEPVAGARGGPLLAGERHRLFLLLETRSTFQTSEPSDGEGHGVLHWPLAEESEVHFAAPGFGTATLRAGPSSPLPLSVVLAREGVLEVALSRPGGAPEARGLRIRLTSAAGPFLVRDGVPHGRTASGSPLPGGSGQDGAAFYAEFTLDEAGPVRIEGLRTGVPLQLSLTDACGYVVAPARELVVQPSEPLVVELPVETGARRLVVNVRDSLGQPVPSAWVRILATGAAVHHTSHGHTDRAGMTLFEGLRAPALDLTVQRRGFETRTLAALELPPEDASIGVVLAHDWWPW